LFLPVVATGRRFRFIASQLSFFLSYLFTHLRVLNPWSSVLLEKLTRCQLVKKFPALRVYETRMFITAFTGARLLCLSRARSIQSIPLPEDPL